MSGIVPTIETIAREICEYPDDVIVTEVEARSSSIIEIKVNKADQGKMIGKGGRTADAIRTIIYSCCFKYNKRFTLDIVTE